MPSGDTGLAHLFPTDKLALIAAPISSPAATTATAQPQAAGLASLAFELPTRGMVYRFTTPRGEQEITARYLYGDVVRRLIELAWVAVAILVVWFIVGMVRRGGFDRLAQPTGSWLLIGLGVVSLFGGILPVVGLILIVIGCWLKVQRLTVKQPA